jgi:hypothetical protein
MENQKTSLLYIIIDFLASLYDMAIVAYESLINFFASLYDLCYDFITFIWEYLKWVTTIDSTHTDYNTTIEEPIHANNHNHFEIQ